jgi:hypothetical protein
MVELASLRDVDMPSTKTSDVVKVQPQQVKRVSFTVDGPLHVLIDQENGTLVIESPVLGDMEQGTDGFMLQLQFSANATNGFVRVLREVERELDVNIGGTSLSMSAH